MTNTAIFTISSNNYFAFAKTFLESVRRFHPSGVDLYFFLADEVAPQISKGGFSFNVVEAKELHIESLAKMAFKYNIMEFNTAIKPFCFKYIFERGYKKAVYFDPDIFVFNPLDCLFSALDSNSILLTPHITEPLPEGDVLAPSEQEYLRAGTYNLGFIGVSARQNGLRFTDWWSERCANQCFSEVETGLFVDQKWVNLAPGLFSEVLISRDKGLNMAYWNLHERTLSPNLTVNGEVPLVFYHFSGIDISDPSGISKYQTRFSLKARPDLGEIFKNYCAAVLANGHQEYRELPYAYSTYSNGYTIGDFARRHYSIAHQRFPDPFRTGAGTYYEYLTRNGLLESPAFIRDVSKNYSRHKTLFNKMLKLLCRFIGVERYKNLLIYMRKISTIRNQDFWG